MLCIAVGELTSIALGASEVTKPIGRIGAGRSRGIKDLRHGLQRSGAAKAAPAARTIPLRLIAARLGSANDGAIARWFGNLVGDGLVSASSAVDHGRAGEEMPAALAAMIDARFAREGELLDRDFVLRWRMAGAKVQPELLVYQPAARIYYDPHIGRLKKRVA